jgi:hypothetical protein
VILMSVADTRVKEPLGKRPLSLYGHVSAPPRAAHHKSAPAVQNTAIPAAPAIVMHLEHIQRTAHAIAGASLASFGPAGARKPLPTMENARETGAAETPEDQGSAPCPTTSIQPFPDRANADRADAHAAAEFDWPFYTFMEPNLHHGVARPPPHGLPILHRQLLGSQLPPHFEARSLESPYNTPLEDCISTAPAHAHRTQPMAGAHHHLLFDPPQPEGSLPVRYFTRPLHSQLPCQPSHAAAAAKDRAQTQDRAVPPRPQSASAAGEPGGLTSEAQSSATVAHPAHVLAPFAQPRPIGRRFGHRSALDRPSSALLPGARVCPSFEHGPAAVDFQPPAWMHSARTKGGPAGGGAQDAATQGSPEAAQGASEIAEAASPVNFDTNGDASEPAGPSSHTWEMRLDDTAALPSCRGWVHANRVTVANPQKGFRSGYGPARLPCVLAAAIGSVWQYMPMYMH